MRSLGHAMTRHMPKETLHRLAVLNDWHQQTYGRPPARTCPCEWCQAAGDELAACTVCGGIRFVRTPGLTPGEPGFGRAVPCTACGTESETERNDRLRRVSGIPERLWNDYRLADLFADIEPRPAIERWLETRRPAWLVLCGDTGLGKTHGAVAIAKALIGMHGEPVRYVVVPEWLDAIRATFNRDQDSGAPSTDDVRRPLFDRTALILDDIAAENTTAWAEEQLYSLVNHRYTRARDGEGYTTIVTTNKRPDEWPDNSRLASRLFGELSEIVILSGQDQRRNPVVRARYTREQGGN